MLAYKDDHSLQNDCISSSRTDTDRAQSLQHQPAGNNIVCRQVIGMLKGPEQQLPSASLCELSQDWQHHIWEATWEARQRGT